MEEIEKGDEFERLPLRVAYEFLEHKNLGNEANEIRQSKDSYRSYTTSLKRGKVLDLLERNNFLEEFINKHWPLGKTEKGKKEIRKYKRIYDSFLNKDRTEEEDEEESIEGTSFAYEEDLKDYLSSNLSMIEPGLKIFKDESGVEGTEYPVDANNKKTECLSLR
jgi:5-methylcytosine-specific restriction endonuclease McrBC GTP-binding regulatory subunit McrB